MSGRRPPEPTGPSVATGTPRRARWVGWSAVAVAATIALLASWAAGAALEVLAALAATVTLSVTILLYRVVLTYDAGESMGPRPPVDAAEAFGAATRRRVLGGLAAAAVVVGAAILGLVGFGPRHRPGTAWDDGIRLTTLEGTPLRASDLPPGGVVTVWPQGAVGRELPAVMLIRLRQRPEPPTRLTGVVDDTLVAYSRLCTHAGCAVALYRDLDQALFCPCHQATFDARRGAVPTSGPASVPLPQLPIGVDDEGYLVATGDLSGQPGPVGGSV